MFGLFEKDPVAAFWAAWPKLHPTLGAGVLRPDDPRAVPLTQRVQAMHPELIWEMGSSQDGARELVVSGCGILERRRVSERWLKAAVATPGWSFAAARPASPDTDRQVLHWGAAGTRLAFSDVRLLLSPSSRESRVDVGLWHPAFPQLPEQERLEVTFIFLDHSLGEDAVSTWVGAIEALVMDPGAAGVAPSQLVALVQRIRQGHAEGNFSLLRGRHPTRGNVMVRFDPALKPLLHLPHEHRLEWGLPLEADVRSAQDAENAMVAALGENLVYVDHHLFPDQAVVEGHGYVSDVPAAEAVLRALRDRGTVRGLSWQFEPDGNWDYYKGLVATLSPGTARDA